MVINELMNGENIIEEKESLKDLGVKLSNDASFSIHVEGVCSKVKQKSSWILRTFSNRNPGLWGTV